MIIGFVSGERRNYLEQLLEKEISEIKNNTISRREFIECIKKENISFNDLCYLVDHYIKPIRIIDEREEFLEKLKLISEEIINTTYEPIEYNVSKRKNIIK